MEFYNDAEQTEQEEQFMTGRFSEKQQEFLNQAKTVESGIINQSDESDLAREKWNRSADVLQKDFQGRRGSKKNVGKHKRAAPFKERQTQHYGGIPTKPPHSAKCLGQKEWLLQAEKVEPDETDAVELNREEWLRQAEETESDETEPDETDAVELSREEWLRQAEETEPDETDALEFSQEEWLRRAEGAEPDQADTTKYSDNNKFYLEEETLSAPYAYARKIYMEGLYRCLDPPNDNDQVYRHNGRYWEPMTDNQLRAIAYQEVSEDDRWNEKSINSFLNQIISYLKYECISAYQEGQRFTERDFRKIQNRIVFRNCVYDAKKGKKLKFDPELPYYFGVNADYVEDDQATYYYDKLRIDATDGDEESIKMFDRALGYLLIPNRTGKCLIVMANARDSGKSILGEFIGNLIEGERTITIDPEHLAGRFAHGRASEAVLYSCLEMNTGKLSQAEVRELKKLTGDAVIRAERKYKDEKNVKIRMKLLLATNTGLILDDTVQDDAFFRRVIVLPFIKSTPLDELIADLPKKLEMEKNYIVSGAVRSLKDIIQEDGGIVLPESDLSKAMKESWARVTHYEDAFMDKCLVITGKESDAVLKDDIYDLYMVFCESSKLRTRGMVCGRNKLMEKIHDRYPQIADRKLRRDSVLRPKGKSELKPCLAGVQINIDYLAFIQ